MEVTKRDLAWLIRPCLLFISNTHAYVYGHQQAVQWRFRRRPRELVATDGVRTLHYILII
jgi:hypothetical protein